LTLWINNPLAEARNKKRQAKCSPPPGGGQGLIYYKLFLKSRSLASLASIVMEMIARAKVARAKEKINTLLRLNRAKNKPFNAINNSIQVYFCLQQTKVSNIIIIFS
jgi:hypothetical protein